VTDLTPDVRNRAAEKARDAAYRDSPDWGGDPHRWGGVVDAVVAVVAPQIARQLRARTNAPRRTATGAWPSASPPAARYRHWIR